ncbi:MAG: glycosyltransferase family 2 protein [Spirochaetia bacterium]|nr:glycosyltransferase family 2 protein [Spirochaetia bacterium]
MKLSVIIPVLNEEDTLEAVVKAVMAVDIAADREVIIVDDGSSDRTPLIINALKSGYGPAIKSVRKDKSEGKGKAIIDAVPHVTGDIVLIQDADMEYRVEDYPELIKPFIEGKADVVFGSRFMGKIAGMRPENLLANKILTTAANILFGLKLTDEATAYKLFRSDIFRSFNLKSKRFEFCPEVVAKSAKAGCRIVEVPVTYAARTVKEGKKIKWQDGFSALWTLIKFRFIE